MAEGKAADPGHLMPDPDFVDWLRKRSHRVPEVWKEKQFGASFLDNRNPVPIKYG